MKLKKITYAFVHWLFAQRRELIILAFFSILACIFWWPLPLYFRSHQLEWPAIDPQFTQWIIAWEQHAIFHYPWRFFEANMFYPFHHTLAWGDVLFSLTLLAIPLTPIFGILGAYNILLIGSSAFSAFTIYLLVHYLTKHRGAGLVAGLIWGFSAFRASEYGHIQILFTVWIPLVFLYAEKVRRECNRKSLWLFILYVTLMLATNIYLLLYTAISFVIYILGLIIIRQVNLKTLWRFFYSWIIAGVLVTPLYLPSVVLNLRHPLIRGYDDQSSLLLNNLWPWPWAGHPIRYILKLFGHPLADGFSTPETIGLLTIPLILVGGWQLIKQRREIKKNWIYLVFLAIAVVAILAALGPVPRSRTEVLPIPNWAFTIPYHFVPAYNTLRVPLRWFVMISFGLAIFAGWASLFVLKKIPRAVQIGLIGLFALWLLFEQSPFPMKTYQNYKMSDFPAYEWLQKQPGEFAIFEVPIYPGVYVHPNDVIEARRMFLSIHTWKYRVSGSASPHIPPEYIEHARVLNALGDDPAAIQLLKSWNIKYVVFSPQDYQDLGWSSDLRDKVKMRLDQMPELRKMVEYNNGTVYQVIY